MLLNVTLINIICNNLFVNNKDDNVKKMLRSYVLQTYFRLKATTPAVSVSSSFRQHYYFSCVQAYTKRQIVCTKNVRSHKVCQVNYFLAICGPCQVSVRRMFPTFCQTNSQISQHWQLPPIPAVDVIQPGFREAKTNQLMSIRVK